MTSTLLLFLLSQSFLIAAISGSLIEAAAVVAVASSSNTNSTNQNNKINNKLCSLGNETYHLGELWNPTLPPFGIQVCVLCECSVRQRKSCYEPKVICRRIISECPIIDSCPDGSKPVTNLGQCCKSCQQPSKANPEVGVQSNNSSQNISATPIMHHQRNERIKEYQTIIKNYEPCPRFKQDSTEKQTVTITNASANQKISPSSSKLDGGGSSKNDLNGIDSRLAFKSLHDSQSNHLAEISRPTTVAVSHQHSTKNTNELPKDSSTQISTDNQQPNDVQQTGSQASNNHLSRDQDQSLFNSNRFFSTGNSSRSKQSNCNTCYLGAETFDVGDRWNPDLPPFGIQYCVQCNCLALKPRGKGCYETKVQCRRTSNDCPKIDICPDGRAPISIPGQCCKTCQSSLTAKLRK